MSGKQIQIEATTNTGISKKSSLQEDKLGQPILPLSSTQPTIIPLYPEPHPIVGGAKNVNICGLCKGEKRSFKSDYDFHMHLTKIHYEDRLMKRINSPYKCQICFYSPPECMSVQEKEEDLLIHYGCNEKLSYQFYQDDGSKLAPIDEISTEISKVAMSCELCKSSHQGERLFVRHITLRHFTKEVSTLQIHLSDNICIKKGLKFSLLQQSYIHFYFSFLMSYPKLHHLSAHLWIVTKKKLMVIC